MNKKINNLSSEGFKSQLIDNYLSRNLDYTFTSWSGYENIFFKSYFSSRQSFLLGNSISFSNEARTNLGYFFSYRDRVFNLYKNLVIRFKYTRANGVLCTFNARYPISNFLYYQTIVRHYNNQQFQFWKSGFYNDLTGDFINFIRNSNLNRSKFIFTELRQSFFWKKIKISPKNPLLAQSNIYIYILYSVIINKRNSNNNYLINWLLLIENQNILLSEKQFYITKKFFNFFNILKKLKLKLKLPSFFDEKQALINYDHIRNTKKFRIIALNRCPEVVPFYYNNRRFGLRKIREPTDSEFLFKSRGRKIYIKNSLITTNSITSAVHSSHTAVAINFLQFFDYYFYQYSNKKASKNLRSSFWPSSGIQGSKNNKLLNNNYWNFIGNQLGWFGLSKNLISPFKTFQRFGISEIVPYTLTTQFIENFRKLVGRFQNSLPKMFFRDSLAEGSQFFLTNWLFWFLYKREQKVNFFLNQLNAYKKFRKKKALLKKQKIYKKVIEAPRRAFKVSKKNRRLA